jgi:hypothetical protein
VDTTFIMLMLCCFGQIMSLRSSDRRRFAALKGLEMALFTTCGRTGHGTSSSHSIPKGIPILEIVNLQS